MSMLAFFPWLRIEQEIHLSPIKLIPYERGKDIPGYNPETTKTIDDILKPYHTIYEKSVERSTLLILDGKDIFHNFNDDEKALLFAATEILAFAGLSSREYFRLNNDYINRDNFTFIIQGFKPGEGGAFLSIRRRDGGEGHYVTEKVYKVIAPFYVNVDRLKSAQINIGLAQALLNARSCLGESWDKYFDSILCFNWANSDSDRISEQHETVFLLAAFQRLLESGHKEDKMVKNFLALFKPAVKLDLSSCKRKQNNNSIYIEGSSLLEIWLRDFNRLRGDYAHGRRASKKLSLWNGREHLLLGSYIFPIIVKLQLQQDKCYSLTKEDECSINVFEKLADADFFKEDHRHIWSEIIGSEKFKAAFEKAWNKNQTNQPTNDSMG